MTYLPDTRRLSRQLRCQELVVSRTDPALRRLGAARMNGDCCIPALYGPGKTRYFKIVIWA